MNNNTESQEQWDHNRWSRIYQEFERIHLELPRRLFIEIAQLQASPPIRRVLDVGCGNGKGLEYLRSRLAHAELVGIDPDPAMVKITRTRLRSRAQVVVASAEEFPDMLGRFDLILSYVNFHLWAEPARGLKRVQAALTDNGMAYIMDVRRDLSAGLRDEVLNCLPQGNFRVVSAAQIDSGLTLEEVRGKIEEAGTTAYRLLTGMPRGSGRGVGIAGGAGRRRGPIDEISRQMGEISAAKSARSISYAQMHLFVYPQPENADDIIRRRSSPT